MNRRNLIALGVVTALARFFPIPASLESRKTPLFTFDIAEPTARYYCYKSVATGWYELVDDKWVRLQRGNWHEPVRNSGGT